MQDPRADPQPCAEAQRCPPRSSAFARPCFFPAPEQLYCRPPVEEGLLVLARPRGRCGKPAKGPPGLRSPHPFSPSPWLCAEQRKETGCGFKSQKDYSSVCMP